MPPCPRRRLRLLATATTLAVVVVFAGTPVAPAAAVSRCDALTGRDRVLSKAITVVTRTVRRASFQGRIFYGCATPRGRVFVLGRAGRAGGDPESVRTFASFMDAGPFLVVGETDIGRGDRSIADVPEFRSRSVIDVRNGRTRELWSERSASGGRCREPSDIGDPARFVIGRTGIVAGAYVPGPCDDAGGKVRIVVSVPGTPRTVIDVAEPGAIPVGSLKLRGRTVSWTNADVAMSKTV